jgi:hypothetical protein
MTTVARLKDGNLYVAGELNERMPPITDGLVAYFPMDGRGGTFDGIGGHQPIQHTTQGVNLIEAMAIDWRDPASWRSNSGMSWDEGMQALRIEGYHCTWLKTPIVVDTTKHYQVSMEVYQEVAPGTGLYLGGLSTNAAGERITPSYDYSYAVNANASNGHLPLGEWVTFRVTRYGTGNITSNNSKSFNKIVGWMGTRSGITDLLTKYYYYGGLFNYSSGGVMYIRNLSVVVVDDDDSNMTITNQGVAINESTINMAPYTTYSNRTYGQEYTAASWGGDAATVHYYSSGGYENLPYKKMVKTAAGTGGSYVDDHIGIAIENNKTYAISAWIKANKDASVRGHALCINRRADNTYRVPPFNLPLTTEWQRFSWVYETGADHAGAYCARHIIYNDQDLPLEIYWCGFQVEEKSYATSFTKGSRTVERLQIPSIDLMSVSEGTVSMWIDVNAAILNKLTNRRIFTHMPSGNPNGFTFRHDASKGWRFWTGNAAGSGTEVTYPSTSTKLGWHHFALRYAQNESALFIDGVKVASGASPHLPAEYMGPIWIGSYSGGEACSTTFKDLAIYNRALSDQEIKQVANATYSLKPSGDLVVHSLNEGPMPVSGAPTLFAFDDSLESNSGLQATFTRSSEGIDPSTGKVVPANAPRFTEGPFGKAVLVEEATTNVFLRYGEGNQPWGRDTSTVTLSESQEYAKFGVSSTKWSNSDTGTGNAYLYRTSINENVYSTTWTFSCYVRRADGLPVTDVGNVYLYLDAKSDGRRLNVNEGPTKIEDCGDGWYRVIRTDTVEESANVGLAGFSRLSGVTEWYFDGWQLEAKPYATSFTEGIRAAETLTIPASDILDLREGTYECWFKPEPAFWCNSWNRVIGHSTGMNRNEVELMRNSTGDTLTFAISNSSGSTLGWNKVKTTTPLESGTWYHVAAVWSVSQGRYAIYLNGVKEGEASITEAYFPSETGTLAVGYHPNGTRWLNSPIVSCRIHRRALTDEEIANIYKQQMRLLPDKLLLQGQLIEGVVL